MNGPGSTPGEAGVAHIPCGLLVLVPVLLVMHHGAIRREEQHLAARFGDEFRRYRSRVRRYL